MERTHHQVLTIASVDHPDPRIDRLGFDLDSPYVEQCWSAVLGPTATLLLRRMPTLWAVRQPATITHDELAGSMGLGRGPGSRSRLLRSLDRCVRFGAATWDADGASLAVYSRLPALPAHQLARVPDWTRQVHQSLVAAHIHTSTTRPSVEAMTRRLDRLQRPTGTDPAIPTPRPQDADR